MYIPGDWCNSTFVYFKIANWKWRNLKGWRKILKGCFYSTGLCFKFLYCLMRLLMVQVKVNAQNLYGINNIVEAAGVSPRV